MIRNIIASILLMAGLFLGVVTSSLAEISNVKVLGLFPNKVLLQIDGHNKVLRVGESYDGIEVISADSKKCTIMKDKKAYQLTLGTDVGVQFKAPEDAIVHIRKDDKGMYRVDGKINNQSVRFLVDTGATQLAMNSTQAKSLNLKLSEDKKVQVDTASGKAFAYQVTLRTVKVGEITVFDVPALVVEGDAPYEVLLGMSFLKRVEMDDKNSVLELKKKY